MLLWAQPESPWKDRIIRLGGRERGKVAQAAFVRSLAASFIKRWQGGPRSRIGGIYGALRGTHETFLNWGREQQAAFLIMAWQELRDAVIKTNAPWAQALLKQVGEGGGSSREPSGRAALFSGADTLLASDQGARGFLCVMNDLLWVAHEQNVVSLTGWEWVRKPKMNDQQAIADGLDSLRRELPIVVKFVRSVCLCLAGFDWRMSSALAPTDAQYARQASYRGSSGYREIRRNMLVHLRDSKSDPLPALAAEVVEALHYETEEET